MPVTDTDRHIIWSGIIVFNCFGLFGNLNVIYAHYRLKELRSKYGILLTMLVTAHSICLLYELALLVYNISGIAIRKNACFYFTSPYIFTYCIQMSLMAAISVDMFFSIAAPLWHRMLRRRTYLTILMIPGITYGIIAVLLGFVPIYLLIVSCLIESVFYVDDNSMKICNPHSSLPSVVTRIWHVVGLFFTMTTIIFYISAFAVIYRKYRMHCFSTGDIERKAMKSLSIIIIVFICERLIFIFLMNYIDFSRYSREVMDKAETYMIFSALTVYSSTFYVCFARSSEYRRIFWEQIVGMFNCCGVKLNKDRFAKSSTADLRKNTESRNDKFQLSSVETEQKNHAIVYNHEAPER